ncbi:hypothetical protein SHI21_04275 [Bacteriovorax sp. PP10]|uniref:Uncharacterized protein n=1 Tax=Bacteriovorax antarcticus TaxID=3088717 RepID=A0ABU5VTR7_9BACT|nr:hypothetical protein [Bacteriovorax sp. PP10]MEA9355400.1 hypothetical protein [Bacteriovorax sp. PP10]
MKILISLFILLNTAFAATPDCIYTGRGEVYDFNGNHLKDLSFDLRLERFKSGPGEFYFNETKTFTDQSTTLLVFGMGWFIGHYSYDDGAGRVVKGQCLNYGYCVGRNEFPDFKGTFVTRFNEREILTTTTTDDLIVDEVVRPINGDTCSFN